MSKFMLISSVPCQDRVHFCVILNTNTRTECLRNIWLITNFYISEANLGAVTKQIPLIRDKYNVFILVVFQMCISISMANIHPVFKPKPSPAQHIHIQKCIHSFVLNVPGHPLTSISLTDKDRRSWRPRDCPCLSHQFVN